MEEHRDFAHGLVKSKDGRNDLWEEIVENLNANGPPNRNADGWKKVWSDYKFLIKGKLRHNKTEIARTGGGPCKLLSISPLEQRLIHLLQMETFVNGIRGTQNFGISFAENLVEEIEREDVNSAETHQQENQTQNSPLTEIQPAVQTPVIQTPAAPKTKRVPRKMMR